MMTPPLRPDLPRANPIVVWAQVLVSVDLENPWLALASNGRGFYPRLPLLAQPCPRGHTTPAPGCCCGVIGQKYLADALATDGLARLDRREQLRVPALAQVYVWGARYEHETYWRAEAAYPRFVCIRDDRAGIADETKGGVSARALTDAITRYYGCSATPVQTFASFDVLVAASEADPPIDRAAIRRITTKR